MGVATYEPIQSVTLTSSSSLITLSSIPSTYTDIYLIGNAGETAANGSYAITINSDSGTNYSFTQIYGTGSAAGSSRTSNDNVMYVYGVANGSSKYGISRVNFQNYSNTTTYKTMIARGDDGSSTVVVRVNLWRSTSAISRLDLVPQGTSFTAGSTFTLYGIKAA